MGGGYGIKNITTAGDETGQAARAVELDSRSGFSAGRRIGWGAAGRTSRAEPGKAVQPTGGAQHCRDRAANLRRLRRPCSYRLRGGWRYVLARGVKIRIADINTPEVSSPACGAEAALGRRATTRLRELLSAGSFELQPADRDEDVYGRKLRVVVRGGHSIGDTLVAEGLAHHWRGYKESWC
ncbi:thermonuclease family protein [Devosia ginsengisoli]|uniref:thermonuclease family protein n=1 Tax=Devosia ginsengisoli TaxID=400770 RepID=UPI00319E1703